MGPFACNSCHICMTSQLLNGLSFASSSWDTSTQKVKHELAKVSGVILGL